jgi:putative peptidoglycan lipid II flippase
MMGWLRIPNRLTAAVGGDGEFGGLLSDSAVIALASAVSRASGLIRVVVIASVLGSTALGDLFVAVNVIPLMLYDVFAGSAISSVLVPPLVRLLDSNDRQRVRDFTARALGLVTVVFAALALVAVLGHRWLAQLLTSGFDAALQQPAVRVAGLLLILILPQLVLYAAIGVMVSIQHAHRRFLLPSVAPLVENLGLMATVAVVWYRYGSGIEVGVAPTELVVTLAVGSGLSVLAHTGLQLVGAIRAQGSPGWSARWRDPDITALLAPARESFGWSGTLALRHFALVVAAGYAGAGGVQAFEMATLAYYIPVALIGRPVASANLPRLTRSMDGGHNHRPVGETAETTPEVRTGVARRALAAASYRRAVAVAAALALPAGIVMILFSRPLAAVIANGEFDDAEAIAMIGYALAGLGIGAASEAVFEVARQTLMALGAGSGLRPANRIRAALSLAGIPAAVVLVDGPMVLLALGLVVSLADAAAFALAHRRLVSVGGPDGADADPLPTPDGDRPVSSAETIDRNSSVIGGRS